MLHRVSSTGRDGSSLPPTLIEHAGLGREVTVAGVYDHVEIWDRTKWRQQQHEVEGSAEDVAERLAN